MEGRTLNNKRFCACGCGQEVNTRFKHGHNLGHGSTHVSWKGGRRVTDQGYILLSGYWNHRGNRQGCVYEHSLVYEGYHKCCLLPWSNVHHKNDNRTDNRPENLAAMMKGQHSRISNLGRRRNLVDMSNRYCFRCGSDKTYILPSGRPQWLSNKTGGFLCDKCRRFEYNQSR